MDYIDQTGYKITLERPPTRIVSIVPSQTELLYYLGITPVGQTIFCFHPTENFKSAQKIGGTKKLQLDKIRALRPDLIIGNKEENQQEQIEELRNEYPVWLSDIYTIADAIDMINHIGVMVDKKAEAKFLSSQIESGFNSLITKANETTLYIIWKDPYMAAGRHTFINNVLEHAGYRNALTSEEYRYPVLTSQEIRHLNPDHILLSSEPFPFQEKHIKELQQLVPQSKVTLVDGELYSWYGPRLLKTIDHLNQ